MSGIYIHIPFCKQACFYCDFHFSVNRKNKEETIDAICKEIELQKHFFGHSNTIETIYFGGGTPSLLNDDQLNRILESISNNFPVDETAEITFECNPDDLSTNYMQTLYHHGVNRLSIGIQSFNDDILQWMNRSHTNKQSLQCLNEAGNIGFKNVTIDLIYGVPQLSLQEWEHSIDVALDLPINHLSAYSLTLENNTPYKRLVDQKKYLKPNDDLASSQFERMLQKIESKGWEHYEVSNFCKPNEYSKHNTAYWEGKKYLGVGPSAHSFNGKQRFWNVSNNKQYVLNLQEGKLACESEILTEKDQFNEQILTRLRTKWGLNMSSLRSQFGYDMQKLQSANLNVWEKEGWIDLNGDVLRLTKKGFLFADYISSELFLDKDYSSQTLS